MRWGDLDPDLRDRFDGSVSHLQFQCGEVRTDGTAGGCYIIRFMRLLGTCFPAPGEHRASTVEVDVLGPGTRSWRRSYAGPSRETRLDTVKTERDGLVEERSGLLVITLSPELHADRIVLRSVRFDIAVGPFRMRVPSILVPGDLVVEHRRVSSSSFTFDMRLSSRRYGDMFIHRGHFDDLRS